jgi:hypothetical protein
MKKSDSFFIFLVIIIALCPGIMATGFFFLN